MIEDAGSIPHGAVLDADFCIAGAGAAGITLARELSSIGKRVVLLVGGGVKERAADRDLYRGFSTPSDTHEPLEENRRRVWGGTTSAWGGRCVPFDPLDFETRPWIPNSGWPLTYDELLPYYHRAVVLCDAGQFAFDAAEALPDEPAEMLDGFDCAEMTTTRLERWSPATNFAKRYGADLTPSNVHVLLGAHLIHVQLDRSSGRVAHVTAASQPSHEFRVTARSYVIACGGLENARILLASSDVAPEGVGNHAGALGRFYMAHLVGIVASAEIADISDRFMYDFSRDRDGVYCRRRFWLTPEAQRQRGVGNAIAFFFRPPEILEHAVHRDPMFSATYLTNYYLRVVQRYGLRGAREQMARDRIALRENLSVVVRGAPRAVPQTARLAKSRLVDDRPIPLVLAPKKSSRHHLFFQTEHIPNRESRVVLHRERDAFGMPRLDVHVAFSDLDLATIVELHRALRARFESSGVGRWYDDEDELRERVRRYTHRFNSNAHHLGTTRMSADPDAGVVDPDSKVHGTDNLYVAGSSVFPTGSHANPTLTIVALALRLADHLRRV